MGKKGLNCIILVLLSFPLHAAIADLTSTFGPVGVTVRSWVDLNDTANTYRYNYQITGISVMLNWFSVELFEDVGLTGYLGSGFMPNLPQQVAPMIWDFAGVPHTSVDAFFAPSISPGQCSCVLFFDSYYAPVIGQGIATGVNNKQFYATSGDVLTPIPEPAMLLLLFFGGLIMRKR